MGLYDDEAPITSGSLGDGKFKTANRLYDEFEDALKMRQPEAVVAKALEQLKYKLPDVIAKYPEHEEVKKWKARAEQSGAKISKTPESGRATDAYMANWSQPAETLWNRYHDAKGYAYDGQFRDAPKWAQDYVSEYENYTAPGSTHFLAADYRPVSDDWKKRHTEWYGEMKTMVEEMKKKV
jgi:hypothetical protein